ncbi:MAG: M28 family peptidase [Planctomycetes bacterium]|nr:M28 family peptidase [Planctomycetota bacterium]
MHVSLALSLLFALSAAPVQESAPPSRALLHELCRHPRLAGTLSARRATSMVARVLEEAGWEVTLDEREVMLSLPRRLSLRVFPEATNAVPVVSRLWTFDPMAAPAGDIPPFNAWAASGLVRGPLVDVGYGMAADFERLEKEKIPVAGCIAVARYGKGYRGVKLSLAEQHGCVGLILFSDPADDGAGKGKTWPQGPWKPAWEAERGSVGSFVNPPGDPSTPGYASPAPGRGMAEGKARLSDFALAQALPKIPCMPIGASDAQALLSNLARRRMPDEQGNLTAMAIGPGPTIAELEIDAPRELHTIVNVIARMQGIEPGAVMAGNHRDAWVRGANDAGSGTVALLRAAQILGAKHKAGWVPKTSILLGFWDAEEFGLIGSTEWVEANEGALAQALNLYINADTAVSGLRFQASGSPGLERFLASTLDGMVLPTEYRGPRPTWRDEAGEAKSLGLPGSGSDFASFLHHVCLPVVDISFTGNSGGQYHTTFDDVEVVERFLDPEYQGHELAGAALAALLEKASDLGRKVLNESDAAEAMAQHALDAKSWLGSRQGQGIANAFRELAKTIAEIEPHRDPKALMPPQIYRSLMRTEGLPLRKWWRNALWTSDTTQGYGSETFPVLRICVAAQSEGNLNFEVQSLIQNILNLKHVWELIPLLPEPLESPTGADR